MRGEDSVTWSYLNFEIITLGADTRWENGKVLVKNTTKHKTTSFKAFLKVQAKDNGSLN